SAIFFLSVEWDQGHAFSPVSAGTRFSFRGPSIKTLTAQPLRDISRKTRQMISVPCKDLCRTFPTKLCKTIGLQKLCRSGNLRLFASSTGGSAFVCLMPAIPGPRSKLSCRCQHEFHRC